MKQNNSLLAVINSQYGKLPPQAIEVEEAVLGALILEETASIENTVHPEWFYKEEHKIIVKQILDINKSGEKVDLLSVTQKLKDNGLLEDVGGPVYVTQLIRKVASAAHIDQHLKIIQDKYTRRELIRISSEITNKSYDETIDIDDIISMLHSDTLGVMDYHKESVHDFSYVLDLLWERIKQNENLSSNITGIPTGFNKLDKFTGGWQGSDLVVVTGESSQGKTSLVLNFVLNACIEGTPGVVYSLEMSLIQMAARLVSSYLEINSKRILFETLTPIEMQKINDGIYRMNNIPLYTDDNVNNSVDSICMSIRRMHLKYNIKFAVVDYIQNVKEIRGKNEEGSLAHIVKSLKNLAKELNITIFAVSQLSRNRDKPVPTMSRLRGSGQIEETADIIISVYRPEYYNIESFPEPFTDELNVTGKAMIGILKGRNIGTGSFLVEFDKTTTTFSDIKQEMHINSNLNF